MSNSKPTGLQLIPIWAHPAPGSRRPRLTREQITDAALKIADAEGVDAVSMRRVAESVGVGTMTLYYYVRSKDDLLALVDDALMGEVLIPHDELPSDWREAMATIARSSKAVFGRHPWALQGLGGTWVGPNQMRHMEQSLAALATSPFTDAQKMEIIAVVDDYVFGHVVRSGDAHVWDEDASDPESLRAVNQFVAEQLETGEYPELSRMIGADEPMSALMRLGQSMSAEGQFERGLWALLDSFVQVGRGDDLVE